MITFSLIRAVGAAFFGGAVVFAIHVGKPTLAADSHQNRDLAAGNSYSRGSSGALNSVWRAKTRSDRKDRSIASQLKHAGVVYIGGQVRNPGPVSVKRGATLYSAIARAEGVTEFGSLKRVKIFRNGSLRMFDLTTCDGISEILEADDTIEIPQKTLFGS